MSQSKESGIEKKEVYPLPEGHIAAIEADGENIQNDLNDSVTQSLFVMNDQQKIYLIRNEDDLVFVCTKIIDFSFCQIIKEVNRLKDIDWSHIHVTENTLSLGKKTYNLNTKL